MNTRYMVTLAVIAGFGLGAVTVQGLHAQAKPPVYYIAEIDVTNLDAYVKEYAPIAHPRADAGQTRLGRGRSADTVQPGSQRRINIVAAC